MPENLSYEEFEEIVADVFKDNVNYDFKIIETWSSMQSLLVVSNIDEQYDILISYKELKNCQTIKDLFEILKQKTES